MKVREMLQLLNCHGWVVKEQTGSHIQMVHPSIPGRITVPNHHGDLKTCYPILKQAGLEHLDIDDYHKEE